VPVATTFWETFFLFFIFLPLLMIWAYALVDIFRRDDIRGLMKALWILVVFLLPFLGTLVYLIVRPAVATREEREALQRRLHPGEDWVGQLQTLSDLHDRGKLTDEEFAAEKARITGAPSPADTTPRETPPAPAA
jgi:hypothetical protein